MSDRLSNLASDKRIPLDDPKPPTPAQSNRGMSIHISENKKPDRFLKHESEISEADESGAASQDSVHQLLIDSQDKTSFLFKVSILLFVYFLVWLGILLWCVLDQRGSRIFYRSLNGKVMGWVFVGLVLFIKVFLGLAGKNVRGMLKLGFVLDLVMSTLAMYCLYNFFNEVYANQYAYLGLYVAFFAVLMAATAFGWLVSILIGRGSYAPLPAVAIMVLCDLAFFVVYYTRFDSTMLRPSKLIGLMVAIFLIDLYLAYEGNQIIEYRAHKYYDDDIFLGFFTLWTDWFSFFWVDTLNHTKFMKKRQKLLEKEEMKKKRLEKKDEPSEKATEGPKKSVRSVDQVQTRAEKDAVSERPVSIRDQPVSVRASEADKDLDI